MRVFMQFSAHNCMRQHVPQIQLGLDSPLELYLIFVIINPTETNQRRNCIQSIKHTLHSQVRSAAAAIPYQLPAMAICHSLQITPKCASQESSEALYKVFDGQMCPSVQMNNIVGEYTTLEPVSAYRHTPDLYRNLNYPHLWEFFHSEPYKNYQEFRQYVNQLELATDRSIENYAICSGKTGQALGFIGLDIRKLEDFGIIQIVNVMYSPKLQKTTMGTEAVYAMLRHSFDLLSCDQVEWLCDVGNKNSFNAAIRYGFYYNGQERTYQNTFQSFYLTKPEWTEIVKEEYMRWLDPTNFDREGRQKTKLQLKPY